MIESHNMIEIITFKGCKPTLDFQAELSRLADARGVDLPLNLTVVPSPARAEDMGLYGSPTILVRGRELQEERRGPPGFY